MTPAKGGTTVPTATDAKGDAAPTKRCDTRIKMLVSAAQVMRERGPAGVTIDEVLARSGAPRGSVYYHFPDRRNQILTEGLDHGIFEGGIGEHEAPFCRVPVDPGTTSARALDRSPPSVIPSCSR